MEKATRRRQGLLHPLAHLLELREALAAMYRAAGRAEPHWTDPALSVGMTPIRAAHLTELRAALLC